MRVWVEVCGWWNYDCEQTYKQNRTPLTKTQHEINKHILVSKTVELKLLYIRYMRSDSYTNDSNYYDVYTSLYMCIFIMYI